MRGTFHRYGTGGDRQHWTLLGRAGGVGSIAGSNQTFLQRVTEDRVHGILDDLFHQVVPGRTLDWPTAA